MIMSLSTTIHALLLCRIISLLQCFVGYSCCEADPVLTKMLGKYYSYQLSTYCRVLTMVTTRTTKVAIVAPANAEGQ